jgi:RNA polymerase sigma-70 factor (ECF subfamily)
MARIVAGDRNAFDLLLHRYWSRLTLYATSILREDEGGNDVVQEAFIRLWQQRESWDPDGSVGAYLYRVTRNLALNEKRNLRLRKERECDAAAGQGASIAPRSCPDPKLREKVEQAISALPERRREVFMLARYHDLTYAEIAETLGISPQTVANQMSSALSELRGSLSHLLSEG